MSQTGKVPTVTAPATATAAVAGSGLRTRDTRRGDTVPALLFAGPSMAGLGLFTIVPIFTSLVMSFYVWPAFGDRTLNGFGNYVDLLGDPGFRKIMLNTAYYAVLYVPLNLVLSLGMAVWIASVRRGRQTLRVLYFVPVVTPMVANVLVWRMIYQPDGAIDGLAQVFGGSAPNFLGEPGWAMPALVLVSLWQGFGYNLLVFSAAIDSIPASINEAANLDGVGTWSRLRHVTIPMISPAMFFASTMTLITTFQVFAQPYLLTGGGPGDATETIVLYIYREGFTAFSLGTAAAAAWILFAVILLVTGLQFAFQRRWVNYDV